MTQGQLVAVIVAVWVAMVAVAVWPGGRRGRRGSKPESKAEDETGQTAGPEEVDAFDRDCLSWWTKQPRRK